MAYNKCGMKYFHIFCCKIKKNMKNVLFFKFISDIITLIEKDILNKRGERYGTN